MKDASSFGFEIVGLEKEELDITDSSQIKEKIKLVRPDILINAAAYNAVLMCEKNSLPAMAVNFIAVQNLARICKENNISFITYSTDYVFDGKKGSPYEESDPPNPLQIYGISKLAGEYAALDAHSKGVFVIRTCGLYGGKKGSLQKGNFVLNIIKEATDKKIIDVSSDQIVSPTYAGDLSKATLKLLSSKAGYGIYHLVNEGYCSWYEFTKEIFKLAGINRKVRPINRGGIDNEIKRPQFSALMNIKAASLGIKLPTWQEGLKCYLEFLDLK